MFVSQLQLIYTLLFTPLRNLAVEICAWNVFIKSEDNIYMPHAHNWKNFNKGWRGHKGSFLKQILELCGREFIHDLK
jgi:hypothetical protein